MKYILIVFAVLLIAGFLIVVKTKKMDRSESAKGELPAFYGKKPLTDIEQTLYHRLYEALPECIVLAQVQVSQIVGIKKGKNWQAWFNKISRKSVDYLICLKDFTIVAAIELDDSSHETKESREKDNDKNTAIEHAGLKIIRWQARSLPDTATILKAFHQ